MNWSFYFNHLHVGNSLPRDRRGIPWNRKDRDSVVVFFNNKMTSDPIIIIFSVVCVVAALLQ